MKKALAAFILWLLPGWVLGASNEPSIDLTLAPGEIQAVPSFEACSVYFRPVADQRGPYRIEFRQKGETAWRRAFDPVSDQPLGIWKGSLFNLVEDTAWEVRVVDNERRESIAPVAFRTWASQPPIARVIDLSQVAGAQRGGLVISDQGTPEGWIKYTAPDGWKIEDSGVGVNSPLAAITVRNARYVILENIVVEGGRRHGILIEDSESVRVADCEVSGWGRVGKQQYVNDGHRGMYADATGAIINLDGGVAIVRSRNTVVERCYLHDPRGRANSWQYRHPAGPSGIFVDHARGGTVVRWNDIVGSDEHRWNDVIESASNRSPVGGFYRDSDISGNFLAFGNDDGAELEGGGMNVRFYRNKVEGTLCGVSTGASLLGPQFIFENLIVHPGDETGLALMFFKNSHGIPQSGKRHHLNNTLYGNASAYGAYGKPAGEERLGYLRNNIFVSNAGRLPGEAARRDDFDGDQFWISHDAGASQAFLDGMRKIGQESRGVAADPQLVAPDEGDFHLQPGSPARGAALAVATLVPDGAPRGAFLRDADELPFRPLALRATPRQVSFSAPTERSRMTVQVSLPASARTAVPFEIRKNRVSTWFDVQPTRGSVAPGKTVTLEVRVDPAKLQGRPNFKGAFLVRTPDGLSRPVSVYAAARFTEELRPANAPNTAYIEAAAQPAVASRVRSTDQAGVSGGRYVAFAGDAREPELSAEFEVPQSGRYSVLVRAATDGRTAKQREVLIGWDGAEPVRTVIEPDYQWNLGATHFRAVYLYALGELKAGRHELRLAVKGPLDLNEIIVTDTPSAFLADGWQARAP